MYELHGAAIAKECTDEEFYWLAEAFEEISEKAQSKDLIAAWHFRLTTVTLENYNQQSFRAEFMRKHITYEEYVKDIWKLKKVDVDLS